MKPHIRRRLTPALVGCGLMAAPVVVQLAGPQREPADETTRGVAAPVDVAGAADPRQLRDPFLDPRRDEGTPTPTVRPGLAGFAVDGVVLRGLVRGGGVFIGILEAEGGRSFFVRGGERLLDGEVVSVGAHGVVVRRGGEGGVRGTPARDVHLTIGGTTEIERH